MLAVVLIIWIFVATSANDVYDRETCGTPTPEIVRLIRGGEMVEARELPWSVYFYTSPNHHCSGILVSRIHVLTAAHCVGKKEPSNRDLDRFRVKMVGMCGSRPCLMAYIRNVSSVSMHEKFYSHRNPWYEDFALLELGEPVPRHVHHACLPTKDFKLDKKNDDIYVSGIGSRYDGDDNLVLMKVLLGKRTENIIFSRGEFTVYVKDGSAKATCAGDSGGGATSIINGRHVVVGINARSSCKDEPINARGIFTDVLSRMKEIKRRIGIQ